MNLVSEDIRFMQIFDGSLGLGRQTTLGVVDDGYFWRFIGGYVFENFTDGKQ